MALNLSILFLLSIMLIDTDITPALLFLEENVELSHVVMMFVIARMINWTAMLKMYRNMTQHSYGRVSIWCLILSFKTNDSILMKTLSFMIMYQCMKKCANKTTKAQELTLSTLRTILNTAQDERRACMKLLANTFPFLLILSVMLIDMALLYAELSHFIIICSIAQMINWTAILKMDQNITQRVHGRGSIWYLIMPYMTYESALMMMLNFTFSFCFKKRQRSKNSLQVSFLVDFISTGTY